MFSKWKKKNPNQGFTGLSAIYFQKFASLEGHVFLQNITNLLEHEWDQGHAPSTVQNFQSLMFIKPSVADLWTSNSLAIIIKVLCFEHINIFFVK